jgi:hypothetical protein
MDMPISFIDFKNSCEAREYTTAIDQRVSTKPANIFAMRTRNGVKVELKVTHNTPYYVTGFGLNPYKLQFLHDELQSRGMTILDKMAKFLKVELSTDILDGFWTLASVIEEIDDLIQQRRAGRFYEAQYDDSVFMYVASDISNMIKYRPPGSPWSRGKVFDDIDRIVTIGYSTKGREQLLIGKNAYREHIVPIDWCINRAFEMFKKNCTVEEVADMFKRNIKVLLISDEEQYLLDSTLGLRTTMPAGFEDGHDPLTRIHHAGIILENNA